MYSFWIRWLTSILVACVFAIPRLFAAESPALLADAAETGSLTEVLGLIDRGADVDVAQVDGMTALHWAAYRDDVELARRLIDVRANVRAANRYGITPLSLACTNGNSQLIELLLDAGADPNTTLPGGETALMTAARTGRSGPVEALLAHEAKVDAHDRRGQTAIMWASAEGHVEVVDALLTAGADFRTPLRSGFTPLFFAVRQGKTEVALRLVEAGADFNEFMQPRSVAAKGPEKGITPLILAVENGHFSLALALLEVGADPNLDRVGYTTLHAISWVRKPIRGDGDPPPTGSGRLTSLELVRHLVEHGADVNAAHRRRRAGKAALNKTRATPFLLAAQTADIPLMQLLIELGADPMATNSEHCTPLLAAAGVGALANGDEAAATEDEAIDAVRFLIDRGADINSVDDNGETALHGAAYKSWPRLVQFLSDHGADVNVWNCKNTHGWTPLLIAQGHRPGNFRPSPDTIRAVERAMRAGGVDPHAEQTAAVP